MPHVACKFCGKEFYTKPNWLKRGYGKYCSLKCTAMAKRKGEFVHCAICGKKIWRMPRFLKRSKSKKFFCSKAHQLEWRHRCHIGPAHPNWKHGRFIEYKSILIKTKIEQKCRLCGCEDKRVLCVHHLDQNRQNCREDNLIWLCLNCHYLAHNYRIRL